MGTYRYEPVMVDLSEYGEGLFAKCLHPKLQPNGAAKDQQRTLMKAASSLPPDLLEKVATDQVDFDKLPMDLKLKLAPMLADQLEAQDELVAGCLLEWNVTSIYDGEAVPVPRLAKGEGKAVFDRVPGGVIATIYARLQEALQEGADPNS